MERPAGQKKTGAEKTSAAAAVSGANDNVWHRIHRNIFTHREPKNVTEDDVLICNCVPDPETGLGCGDECINRDVLVECDPNFCPCGSGCQNQKFQSKEYAKLDIRRTGRKGHGLFAKQTLRKGQFVIEYVGEVLHEDEYRSRKQRYESEEKRHYYFMTLSSSETIDAAERGNAGRFLNHSCQPNCETQKWMVNGELCIGIHALEDIAKDEELTFDYNFERYGENPIKCFCGTEKCGGWIGGGQKRGDAPDSDVSPSGDSEEDQYDFEPAPVMLEADADAIAMEETRGREARNRARLDRRRGGLGSADPLKPRDAYGNDDDDYDGDGEIAARKREIQREANKAAREANRLTIKSSLSVERGLRRSGSLSMGGRKTSSGSFGRAKRTDGTETGLAPSYYGVPSTARRRSEVDVSMERLRGSSGALRNAKAAVKCVRLFNLAYPVAATGTQSVSQRDLGLLLEAVALTTNPQTQFALVEKGLLQALQMCIQRLGGAEASGDRVPILRKVVKIIDSIFLNAPSSVAQKLRDTRTARGCLARAIGDLRVAKDAGLRALAVGLAAKLPADAVAPPPTRGGPPETPGGRLGSAGSGMLAMGYPGGQAPIPPVIPAGMGGGFLGVSPGGVSSTASGAAPDSQRGWGLGAAAVDHAYGVGATPAAARRGLPPGREPASGGYAPGGGGVPGVSSLGHGEHFDRRGAAGDGSAQTPMRVSMGSAPTGSAPTGSAPMGSTPTGSTPMGSAPMGGASLAMGGDRGAVTPMGSAPTGSTMRPTPAGSAPAGSARGYFSGNATGNRLDFTPGGFPLSAQPYPGAALRGSAKSARPGDWLCPHGCGNVFASKPRCFRCGAARPADAATFGGNRGYAGVSPAAFGGGFGYASRGTKRDRDELRNGVSSSFPSTRGGWGGVVREGEGRLGASGDSGADASGDSGDAPFLSGAPAPPPGMGVSSSRAAAPVGNRAGIPAAAPPPVTARASRAPTRRPDPPIPSRPPATAETWDSPLTQRFGDDVFQLTAWSMVPFRSPSHPLFMPGANYDRLIAKLTNAVVEKEQTKWRELNAPIPRAALEERLERYCRGQVKAMHAERLEGAANENKL